MLTAKIHTECKEYIWVLALEEGTSIAEKPLGMGGEDIQQSNLHPAQMIQPS